MRLSLRLILPLTLIIGLFSYGIVPLLDTLALNWFVRDLDKRTKVITEAIQHTLVPLIQNKSDAKITDLFNRVSRDERIYALGFCDLSKKMIYKTPTFPDHVQCSIADTINMESSLTNTPQGSLHITFQNMEDSGTHLGQLMVLHDMSFVQKRSAETKKYIVFLCAVLSALISFITVMIVQLSWKGWINGLRDLVKGEGLLRSISQIQSSELRSIVKDFIVSVRDLKTSRRAHDESHIVWSPKRLKEILQQRLAGDEILIVSNREPYIHAHNQEKIEVQFPASGVVTALEPIMRACSGTWIAHGCGNADKDVVDKYDHIKVPPDNPSYQLRRVWLTKEEEAGYYCGFANEGLWPLCHIAHVRPNFRSEDWNHYVAVNRKFANAVIEESKTEDPVVLVQDYHFALLPKMIKEKLPKATIITFWHIPWPNPEAFGICPSREEILDGLLGSSILGFHTRFHCNNFIDTVDRFIECRIDRETSTISYGGRLTAVNHYPISIEYPVPRLKSQKAMQDCKTYIRQINQLPGDRIVGIGVDRLDYTKGILERFQSIERLLELNPKWIGKFTFIQIAAPSRTNIDQYQRFDSDVRAMATKINLKYAKDGYEPILLKIEHHEPDQVYEYFRGSEICVVSSLHDGMNLVAKEYIAARDNETGVLILSQFTGASRELPEALIVNPYNIDQCASALNAALEMPIHEQKERMKSMRGLIQEYNVYRWAGRMLVDASRIRQKNRLHGRFRDAHINTGFTFSI